MAIICVKKDAKILTTILSSIIKVKNCKNIIVEKRTLWECLAYAGINTCVKAPSAKIRLNKLGNLNATKNISL